MTQIQFSDLDLLFQCWNRLNTLKSYITICKLNEQKIIIYYSRAIHD